MKYFSYFYLFYAVPTILLLLYLFWPQPTLRPPPVKKCKGYTALDVNHIITCDGDTLVYERNVHKHKK